MLLAFEESEGDLATNVASLGFDLPQLVADGKLAIDAFRLDPAEFVETGSFDLEGLFIRLAMAVESVGAKRVVLDTLEVLFSALPNQAVIRSELGRLFRWLKERDLTVVITGERGGGEFLTKFGIEEYVSDCVVVLDHRVARRDLHPAPAHREVPRHPARHQRVPVPDHRRRVRGRPHHRPGPGARGLRRAGVRPGSGELDDMLGGGVYRGSSVMISGSAGTGKTSIAALMADAACARGERALFISFEESPSQLTRNMASIGIDLQRWIDAGQMLVHSVRPTAFGFEEHLAQLHRLLDDLRPARSRCSTRWPASAAPAPRARPPRWSRATSTCSRAAASPR